MITRTICNVSLLILSVRGFFTSIRTASVPRTSSRKFFSNKGKASLFSTQSLTDSTTTTNETSTLTSKSSSDLFDWKKQWYPALPMSVLEEHDSTKPIPMTILNEHLVIWKSSSSSYSVLADRCPHRQAPLSTGKVVGGCNLMCRFHGWEFDSKGACTSIPMMPDDSNNKTFLDKNVFRAISYPTQVAGGLLWVFMDPTVPEHAIPAIPPEILLSEEEAQNAQLFLNTEPVSYLSMIENSFDPSHAPFVHEGIMGFDGEPFSPSQAVPMLNQTVTKNLHKGGFTLEHSPYDKITPEGSMTERKFIPPVTNLVPSVFFKAILYFIPSTPRETHSIGYFTMPKQHKKQINLKSFLFQLLPSQQKQIVQDYKHLQSITDQKRLRFQYQDRMTMHGQDQNKILIKKWDDITPTKSDVGVRSLQGWMRRYGPPFPLLEDYPKDVTSWSLWDAHAKHCPKCQRMLNRFRAWETTLSKYANYGLIFSVFSSLIFALCKNATVLFRSSMVLFMASMGAKWCSAWMKQMVWQFRDGGNGDLQRHPYNVYQF